MFKCSSYFMFMGLAIYFYHTTTGVGVHVMASPDNESAEMSRSEAGVRFNNPKMLQDEVLTDDSAEYDFDTTQEEVDVVKFGGLNIRSEAKTLSMSLRQLSNSEMKVPFIQGMFDSLQYTEVQSDYWTKLTEVTKSISTKLNQYVFLLRTTRLTVENLYQQHRLKNTVDFRFDCCSIPSSDLKWDDGYQISVNRDISCDLLPTNLGRNVFNPGRNITEVFQYNFQLIPSIKWQYFITSDGIHNEYPAHNYFGLRHPECRNMHDVRHRAIQMSAFYPWRKNTVIVIDIGNSLSTTQLRIAKAIAKYIISSLGENDWVGIVAVSDEVKYPILDRCLLDRVVQLSNRTRLFINRFIEGLEKESAAINHSLAFSVAYNLTRSITDIVMADVLVAYVSRGLLSSLTEPQDVFTIIDYENGRTRHQVVIDTFAVVDDQKPVMYEQTFMQDVADQNFTKYHVERRNSVRSRRGKMVLVNSTQNLGVVVGDPFQPFNWTINNMPVISVPQKDEVSKGVVLSVAWSCIRNGKPFGVVGLDVHLNEVVEPALFEAVDASYMFVIDKKGLTVVHPMLDSLMMLDEHSSNINISYFEDVPGFSDVLKRLTSEISGRATISLPINASSLVMNAYGELGSRTPRALSVTYMWQHVIVEQSNETAFIVVVRNVNESTGLKMIKTSLGSLSNYPRAIYHRLDLMPTDSSCIHFKQLATMDTGTVFLSSRAFQSPFEYLHHDEVKRMVQGYLAYLNDGTNLISNPGILEHVRNDVLATSALNAEWIHQSSSSQLSSYIVRRYLALPSGVLRMYPGTLMNKSYDPTKRHWYMRALEFPGKIILTPPYLDAGGAGYIVTISHTIYQGKSTAFHGSSDPVAAVVGMDVTMKYFYKKLVDQIPVCDFDNIRCFIMDDRGYLVVHRGLADPSERGPLEERHITRKEPLVTNDILNHHGFVHKKTCSNYIDGTVQRSYQFNTSMDGVITNLVHGEHCARYQIVPLAGTNAFIGIVNQTCDIIRAFCPCSMFDRLCLNCLRMEQTECECPCECPMLTDVCMKDSFVGPKTCAKAPEDTDYSIVEDITPRKSLPVCFQSNCARRISKNDCIGVLDCEWCELETDASTQLRRPFCGTQRTCFNGVLGASSPYNDEDMKGHLLTPNDDLSLLNKSMPVGPVAGGIMGFFLLMALGVYCYRHHARGHSRSCNGSLPGEAQLRDSNNDLEDFDDMNKGHTNIMLATFDNQASAAAVNAASINPYFMNTAYRRPVNTPASDLGYSTMTPHGDDTSEQASTVCVESSVIAVVGRDRYRPPPSSSASTSSSSILPPPPQHSRCRRPLLADVDDAAEIQQSLPEHGKEPRTVQSSQTVLPEMSTLLPHQFVADVQVHSLDVH